MLVDREGRFRGPVTGGEVTETGEKKLATVVLGHALTEEWNGAEWVDISAENLEIRSYHYLETKSGGLNEFAITGLRETLGWNGSDLSFFGGELPAAQVTVALEEWDGRVRPKVKWVNAFDSERGGGEVVFDPEKAKAINARLGSKLRAHAGGSSAPAPKPTGARPAAPKPAAKASGTKPAPKQAPRPAPTPKPSAAFDADLAQPLNSDDGWQLVYAEQMKAGRTDEEAGQAWFEAVATTGQDIDQIEDFRVVVMAARKALVKDLPY